MTTTPSDPQQRHANTDPRRLRVFINYRHDDTWGQAHLLYDRLANRFGSENVFLDVRSLQPGMKWLDVIKSRRDSCDVLLSLIGPLWTSIMKARDQAAIVRPVEDYVRIEIQYALQPDSGICVIPVLVGDDVPFAAEELPRSLQALAKIEVAQARPEHFEQDIALLIGRLETIAREHQKPPKSLPAQRSEGRDAVPAETSGKAAAPPPDAAHHEEVLRQMVDEGNLAVFLGSRLPFGHADPLRSLRDAQELATSLAERFGMKPEHLDLPEIAQHVYVTRGRSDLYTTLRQLLKIGYAPGPVHRFLARFPRTLRELGLAQRYQLIVSTNFDMSLEQAFDEEQEPYDLAVYMASGPDKGKFVHFPPEGAPKTINEPNSYTNLPIGVEYELERTVIVKIHGAVDGSVGAYRFKDNYVITEDHYIDYLSRSPIESLVPVQVLDKLRESHCLFLGYPVRDWNLRVFMKRIWDGSPGATSWAVEPNPDTLEKRFWAQSEVELYAADLADYVDQIQEQLIARAAASAEP
jgi:SIR2-like domain/TIR domain